MQPRIAKTIGATALGVATLGAIVWWLKPTPSVPVQSGPPVAAPSATAAAEPVGAIPSNVVTMLGVPEVILSLSPGADTPAAEAKPLPAANEDVPQPTVNAPATLKSVTPATRKVAGKHSSDTFLIKPQ